MSSKTDKGFSSFRNFICSVFFHSDQYPLKGVKVEKVKLKIEILKLFGIYFRDKILVMG